MKVWRPHGWEACVSRLERRLGRELHWWEAERLRDLLLSFDRLKVKAQSLRSGGKLATFEVTEGQRALTWTIPEAA